MTGAIFCILIAGLAARDQAPDPPLQFEVASIKPTPPSDGGRMRVGTRGGPGTPEEQLGLRLEATKTMVDNLIVDYMDRTPTDN